MIRVGAKNGATAAGGGPAEALAPSALVDRLFAARDTLGPWLVERFEKRDPLSEALRDNLASRVVPEPDEALGVLLIQLLRAGGDLDAWAAKTPGSGELLAQLGGTPSGSPAARTAFVEKLASVIDESAPYFERSGLIDRIGGMRFSAEPVVIDPSAALRAVGQVSRSSAVHGTPALPQLAQSLSYGGGEVVALLSSAFAKGRASLLARAVFAGAERTLPGRTEIAARLLRVLSEFRDPKTGAVNLSGLERAFGAEGAALAAALDRVSSRPVPERPNYPFLAEVVGALRRLMPARAVRPLVDALVRNDQLIPAKIEVLDRAAASVRKDRFSGEGLVAVQHLFPTLVPLVEKLIEKGMKPEDIHILGTPYTRNPLVAEYLSLLGVHVQVAEDTGLSTRGFEEHRQREIAKFLTGVASRKPLPPKGVQVLDDGGLLHLSLAGHGALDAATRSIFEKARKKGVEQTTRGLTELSKHPLSYDIVTVGDAEAKRREGKIIGWSLASSLVHEMRQTDLLDEVKHISLVGAGTVGLETGRELRDLGFGLSFVDLDEGKRKSAEARGFEAHASLGDVRDTTDLVFGATGKRSLNGAALLGFDGVIASGSSAAIEADASQIAAFGGDGPRRLNLLRPINFQGDGYEDLSPAQIGLTRTLLFGALAQETPEVPGAPKRVTLDVPFQDRVLGDWVALGGEKVAPIELRPKPLLARPDSLDSSGTATHDEWMTFLKNHPLPVNPPPNQSRYAAGRYTFQDADGTVRLVDTRVGRSAPTGLPGVPSMNLPAMLAAKESDAPSLPGLALGGRGEEGWAAPLKLEGDAWTTGKPSTVGQLGAVFFGDGETPGSFQVGAAFKRDGELTLLRPGRWDDGFEKHTIPGGTKNSLVRWVHRKQVLWIEKQPPRLVEVNLDGGPAIGLKHRLPKGMVSIEAVAHSGYIRADLLIGRDASGRLVLSKLHPPGIGDPPVLVLPEGAEFRGFRPDPADALRWIVDYNLAGEPDELDAHHQATLDAVGGFGG